ncbi:MAG: hypothetical protein U1D99_04410, partial [Candidatus Omnitrophota bacterium]|nr:hypothetical protein [Candidatus Omnitrophota bacterium]
YSLISEQRAKLDEISTLKEQVALINAEKETAEGKAAELEDAKGRSIEIEKLIGESRKIYGDEEKGRTTGLLWVDREESRFIITLGVLNGLVKGSLVTVYDGDKTVATLLVEVPMDVISYTRPLSRKIEDFTEDYYRVKIEGGKTSDDATVDETAP